MRTGKKIGILTAGGDCPGLNAAIRGVGKAALLEYGMEVYGFSSGFQGLAAGEYRLLGEGDLSGILTLGGTILGTSRLKPFGKNGKSATKIPALIEKTYRFLGLDALVCMGGNGTMKTAYKLSLAGLNIVGLPKTIDNDVWGTDFSFGFDSAVAIATDAIDRIHTTANSHRRIMVVEVMGHNAGWLALFAGVAGGGDIILIPEIEVEMDAVCDVLRRRADTGKPYSIVVVAEGARIDSLKQTGKGQKSIGRTIAKKILEKTRLETRETILGYIQRGGVPSAGDRLLASRLGTFAADMIANGDFGAMAACRDGKFTAVPLEEVAGKVKTVPHDHPLIRQARMLGTTFGDRLP